MYVFPGLGGTVLIVLYNVDQLSVKYALVLMYVSLEDCMWDVYLLVVTMDLFLYGICFTCSTTCTVQLVQYNLYSTTFTDSPHSLYSGLASIIVDWTLDVIKTCILCSVAVSVSFQPAQYSVTEGNKTTVTLVTNSSAYSFSFTVSLMFMDDTATSGSDYVPMPVSVTFSPGQQELSFEVMATVDQLTESSESFMIIATDILVPPTCRGDLVVLGTDTAYVNIADSNGRGLVVMIDSLPLMYSLCIFRINCELKASNIAN